MNAAARLQAGVTVWWVAEDLTGVHSGIVRRVDSYEHVHFQKVDGAIIPPSPQAAGDCHLSRYEAAMAGLCRVHQARLDLDAREAVLRQLLVEQAFSISPANLAAVASGMLR